MGQIYVIIVFHSKIMFRQLFEWFTFKNRFDFKKTFVKSCLKWDPLTFINIRHNIVNTDILSKKEGKKGFISCCKQTFTLLSWSCIFYILSKLNRICMLYNAVTHSEHCISMQPTERGCVGSESRRLSSDVMYDSVTRGQYLQRGMCARFNRERNTGTGYIHHNGDAQWETGLIVHEWTQLYSHSGHLVHWLLTRLTAWCYHIKMLDKIWIFRIFSYKEQTN